MCIKTLVSIFLLFFCINYGIAQDTPVVISTSMLNDTAGINISTMDGWVFTKNYQPDWANEKMETTNWQRKKPIELSVNDADQNGRVEGWFRIKIKPDNSFINIPIGFKYNGCGAAEVFLDGKPFAFYGEPGNNDKTFQEYHPVHRLAIPLGLVRGTEHLIAVHFVDYVSDFPLPKNIRSFIFLSQDPYTFSSALFSITGPEFNAASERKVYQHMIFKVSLFAIVFIITILFWLISYQNPGEINLRLFSIFSSLGVLLAIERVIWHSQDISFRTVITLRCLQPIIFSAAVSLLPMILAESLQQRKPSYLKKFMVMSIMAGIVCFVFFNNSYLFKIVNIIVTAISFLISGLIIYNCRKTTKGAQWAIVIGFLLGALTGFIVSLYKTRLSFPLYIFIDSFTFLSLPCAYIIYISIRFREIIHEVKENASQLVMLSEEKKTLIASQNEILERQVIERTSALNQSLQDLKATQTQLIHSEKMASLGELTAGIAHEIQNPLNFINNFSELNLELIDEFKNQAKGKKTEDGIDNTGNDLLRDIEDNLQKISHHGKRADGIVKGMLHHSRSSAGHKETTDLNALCDEYLRLAYHGLRARDKSFNAQLETHFDAGLPMVNVVRQDVGRVILNIINNALYAVHRKKSGGPSGYQPTVSITTAAVTGKVRITIKDNGTGIPEQVQAKIFQPFFTTKPTGEGTGLGLSLSYDIITKGHNGSISVFSVEGEGATFIIEIPAA